MQADCTLFGRLQQAQVLFVVKLKFLVRRKKQDIQDYKHNSIF